VCACVRERERERERESESEREREIDMLLPACDLPLCALRKQVQGNPFIYKNIFNTGWGKK